MVWEKAWARQRGRVPLLGGIQEEGWDRHRSFFLCSHTSQWQGTAYMTPGVGESHHCHLGLYRQARTAAAAEGPMSRHWSLPPPSWERAWPAATAAKNPSTGCHPLPPPSQEHTRAVHLHTPYEGANSEHMLRKEMASIQTKKSPHAKKILNPHKLCRDAHTYK